MKQLGIISAVIATLASAGSLAAHHSAAQFDFSKSVSITGVVKKFQAINPHMRLVLEVADAKGSREIEFEGHSTNNMYRSGYRDKMIQVGDRITVHAAPLRDGSEGGYVVAAVTAKGVRFGAATPGEAARERERAEGRGGR
jgi:hypothetical protein